MHPNKQLFSDILKSKRNLVLLRNFTSTSHQTSQAARPPQGCAHCSLETTGLMCESCESGCACDPVQCYNEFSLILFLSKDKICIHSYDQ